MQGVSALSVSLFHFRVQDFLSNNLLFAVTLFPNLVKELVGLNYQ